MKRGGAAELAQTGLRSKSGPACANGCKEPRNRPKTSHHPEELRVPRTEDDGAGRRGSILNVSDLESSYYFANRRHDAADPIHHV